MEHREHREQLAHRLRLAADGLDTDGVDVHLTADLREAADLIDPNPDDSTVDVRILARVDVIDGEAYVAAAAYPNATEDDLFERVGLDAEDNWTDHPRYTWITARVPKPVIDEVEGTVGS